MEHIVQFAVNIDDEQIKKTVERNVVTQVVAEIRKDCMKELTGKISPNTYQYSQRIKEIVDSNIKEFLDSNKEIIIKEAVNQLAERLSRTKAAKDALNKTIESIF